MLNRWNDDWNDIIRYVIFADEELKRLMKIPENTNIITFIDKYFIEADYTTKVLKDESVRVIYKDITGADTEVPNVKKNMMTFDIYVKLDDLHNADVDRLKMRTRLIAARLYELLTKERYLNDSGYRFWIALEGNQGTRTIGYARYMIAFYYMKVY